MYDDTRAQLAHCEASLKQGSGVSTLWILTLSWSIMLTVLHLVSFLVLMVLVFRVVWLRRPAPPPHLRSKYLKESRLLPTFVQVALLLAAFAPMVACAVYLRSILEAKASVDYWAPQLFALPGLANTTEALKCTGYPFNSDTRDSCDVDAFLAIAGWPKDDPVTTVLMYFVFTALSANVPFLSRPAGAQVLGLMAGMLRYTIASLLISLVLATGFRLFNLIRFSRKLWGIAKRQKAIVEEYYDVATSSYPKSLLAKPTALGNISPITSARAVVGKTRTLGDYFKSRYLTEAHFFLVALLYSHLYAFFIQFWVLVALLTLVPATAALVVFFYAYTGESPEKGLASLVLWLKTILVTVVAPYLFRMLLQLIESHVVVDRTDGIVHPIAHAQLFFFQMLASLGYGQYVVVKRLAFVLAGLIIRIGEIDTQLGVLDTDTIFKSYAGVIELMRLRAEFELKCRAKFLTPSRAEKAKILADPSLHVTRTECPADETVAACTESESTDPA
jgi:hypothetical protein